MVFSPAEDEAVFDPVEASQFQIKLFRNQPAAIKRAQKFCKENRRKQRYFRQKLEENEWEFGDQEHTLNRREENWGFARVEAKEVSIDTNSQVWLYIETFTDAEDEFPQETTIEWKIFSTKQAAKKEMEEEAKKKKEDNDFEAAESDDHKKTGFYINKTPDYIERAWWSDSFISYEESYSTYRYKKTKIN